MFLFAKRANTLLHLQSTPLTLGLLLRVKVKHSLGIIIKIGPTTD